MSMTRVVIITEPDGPVRHIRDIPNELAAHIAEIVEAIADGPTEPSEYAESSKPAVLTLSYIVETKAGPGHPWEGSLSIPQTFGTSQAAYARVCNAERDHTAGTWTRVLELPTGRIVSTFPGAVR